MIRHVLSAATLVLALSATAFAAGPAGPAGDAVRKWFTSDMSLGCVDPEGNDRPCRFNPDSQVDVKYAPSGTEAVAFATYINDETGNAQQFAVAVFRKEGAGWRFVRNAQGIRGTSASNVSFRDGKVNFDTATLRDKDSRCCPTGRTHWSIPLR